jgi:hypothetical protein
MSLGMCEVCYLYNKLFILFNRQKLNLNFFGSVYYSLHLNNASLNSLSCEKEQGVAHDLVRVVLPSGKQT